MDLARLIPICGYQRLLSIPEDSQVHIDTGELELFVEFKICRKLSFNLFRGVQSSIHLLHRIFNSAKVLKCVLCSRKFLFLWFSKPTFSTSQIPTLLWVAQSPFSTKSVRTFLSKFQRACGSLPWINSCLLKRVEDPRGHSRRQF